VSTSDSTTYGAFPRKRSSVLAEDKHGKAGAGVAAGVTSCDALDQQPAPDRARSRRPQLEFAAALAMPDLLDDLERLLARYGSR
jgi:hypothetical protein